VCCGEQDRELLQRTGDDLDAKIRKAEKEVRALEATLSKLNDKNRLYRSSMKPVADQGRLGERQALRDQLDKAYDRCAPAC
jgi:septal ring factor EnvC (AmiA/AmiB activator)